MKIVFVASIIRNSLCLVYVFFYHFFQKSLFTENYILIAAINLASRGPLYTCLVSLGFRETTTSCAGDSKVLRGSDGQVCLMTSSFTYFNDHNIFHKIIENIVSITLQSIIRLWHGTNQELKVLSVMLAYQLSMFFPSDSWALLIICSANVSLEFMIGAI